MELKESELKAGQIFVYADNCINKIKKDGRKNCYSILLDSLMFRDEMYSGLDNVREATNEEKHWLNSCISANKFIPRKKALKDFNVIPEYVELLEDNFGYFKGDIAKVIKRTDSGNYEVFVPNRTSLSCLSPNVGYVSRRVTPSTKEAFEAQNKPKSLVNRYVKCLTEGGYSKDVFTINNYYKISNVNSSNSIDCISNDGEFLCMLLNIEVELMPEGFIPPKLAESHEIPKESINEGLNKAQEKVIDKSLLYGKDLLAEARRRYPVGTRFISPENNNQYEVSDLNGFWEGSFYDSYSSALCSVSGSSIGQYIYKEGRWAEIVEPFKSNNNLPENYFNKLWDDAAPMWLTDTPSNTILEPSDYSKSKFNQPLEVKVKVKKNRVKLTLN